MKIKFYLSVFTLVAGLISILNIDGKQAIAQFTGSSSYILAQNPVKKPQVNLNLVAYKRVLQKNAQGQEVITWKALEKNAQVQSGEVIRFTVTGKNIGNSPAKNFALTQPIPRGMVYQLSSATSLANATLTYSIDRGRTFVAKPTIKVTSNGKTVERPAPAESYTHIRWSLSSQLEPNSSLQAAYLLKVK